MIESRCQLTGRHETHVVRWFLLFTLLSLQRMLDVARAHWIIENQLHWALNVDISENAARAPQGSCRTKHRKLALYILRQHPDKGSIN